MKKKTAELRRTFAVREVLRVGRMADGVPYLASKVGPGRSYALDLCDARAGDFEDSICNELALNKGDKVEFFMTVRKVVAK